MTKNLNSSERANDSNFIDGSSPSPPRWWCPNLNKPLHFLFEYSNQPPMTKSKTSIARRVASSHVLCEDFGGVITMRSSDF